MTQRADQSPKLEYRAERRPGHSVWAVVGFAASLLSLVIASPVCWLVARALAIGHAANIGVKPPAYAVPGLALVLCIIGALRGAKSLAAVGIAFAIFSLAVMVVGVMGSPWK